MDCRFLIPILTHEEFTSGYNIKSKQLKSTETWFPLYPSKCLAEITAALMTDGHIDWNDYDGNPRPKKIILYSNFRNECKWFLDTVSKQFGIRGKIITYRPTTGFSKNDSYKAIIYDAPLARILIRIGVPRGDKTLNPYVVPDWIMNGDMEIKRSFLRILFNFDGSISIRKTRSGAELSFCFNKHERYIREGTHFMEQIKDLLFEFDVPSGKIHIRKTITERYPNNEKLTFVLFISNHKGIINFYREMGFLNRSKQGKLQKFIYKTYMYARIPFNLLPQLLKDLKNTVGSDKDSVSAINQQSPLQFTFRQFEHIRRGELKIPLQMAVAAMKILDKKEEFEKIPKHYRDLINIYDNFFLR